jgi:flavin-dependent dehydrogenase
MAMSTATRTVRRGRISGWAHTADLCIVGAGIGGVSAALEAAKLGRRIVLADGAPSLGGQSVGAMIGTFCGLYSNGPQPEQVTHGIADEILRDLLASGDAHLLSGRRNTIIVQYRIEPFARWVEEKVRAAGIEVLLGALLRGATRRGRRLAQLQFTTRYGDVTVAAPGFIDASGDAALAWHAGLELREAAETTVHGTVMLSLEGVDEAALAGLPRDALAARLAERAEIYGLVRHDGFAFAFPGSGEALVNLTHIETPLEPFAASRMVLEGRAQADRVHAFLRTEFPKAFGRARVRSYGLPGVRQTRMIASPYQLTAKDIRAGRDFPDAIARCSWPIELHDRPEGAYWEEFGDGHMHYVPFRSLVPREIDNVVAVGRCIDADPVALSSVRVMGPCIAMGAAAAHAFDLAGAGSLHQLDIEALRRRVAANLGL